VGDRVAFGIMPIDDPAVSAAEPGQTHAKSQTLTRSELYELVWSKPVCDVAEDTVKLAAGPYLQGQLR
jgi:hypothetical protein